MDEQAPPPLPTRRILPLVLVGLMSLGVVALGWSAFLGNPGRLDRPGQSSRPPVTTAPTAAEALDSPFLNVRPGVGYVGDVVCARCHTAIAETYRNHPMGQSLAPAVAGEAGPPAARSFSAQGFEYTVQTRGDALVHEEARRDAQGRTVAARAETMTYTIGSGRGGKSFLFERDGFVFQSPATWYTQEARWDLAPGFEKGNLHFERPIGNDCLYCHANRVELVPGTENRYRAPTFQGMTIGCERCHGPGALHAQRQHVVNGIDLTIVNPRHLDPVRRDSVCEQCHLKGDYRIPHAGLDWNDFRPGLPLHRFFSVFFRPEKLVEKVQVVGHVEQMQASRCYQASAGKLGCISCHDPHQRPAPDERVAYFRNRCLECHAEHGCTLPEPARRARNRDDSCMDCHMPRSATIDVTHVATTLHRIPRVPGDQPRLPEQFQGVNPERDSLVHFHRLQVGGRERSAVARDLAVALARASWELRTAPLGEVFAGRALPTLERALASSPDDLAAHESKGLTLIVLGRPQEALAEFQALLKRQPEHEQARAAVAVLTAELGRPTEAIALWKRALALNPWPSHSWFSLAALQAETGAWQDAAASCRQALRANPAHQEAQKLLAQALLHLGDREQAK